MEWGLLATEAESELKRLEKCISLLKKTRKNRKQKMPKEFHTTSSKKYTCKNEEDPIPYKIKSVQYFAQRVVN